MHRFTRARRLGPLVALAAGCALTWATPCLNAAPPKDSARLGSLPFEIQGNLIIVRMAPDGLPELTLIFDTGSNNTVIDVAAARRLGLETEEGLVKSQGAGGQGQSQRMKGTLHFHVGSSEIEASGISIVDLASLGARVGLPLDGIIGGDVLADHIVRIDYVGRRIDLLHPDAHRSSEDGVQIDFRHGIPTMKVRVAGPSGRVHEGSFYIDTGASRAAVISGHFAERVGFPEEQAPTIHLIARGAYGSFPTQVTRLRRMDLGPHRLDQPVVLLSGARAGILADRKTAGVIGGAALRRFTVTIDTRARLVHLDPNEEFDAPDDFDASGMQLQADGERLQRIVVSGVLPRSPAEEHGIVAGDQIVAVDGRKAEEFDLEWLRGRLREAGSEVALELERAGRRRSVRLELRTLL